jgi:hypothetical protein
MSSLNNTVQRLDVAVPLLVMPRVANEGPGGGDSL